MKNFIVLFISFFTFYCSYGNNQEPIIYNGDTINVEDDEGLKQGEWYVFGRDRQELKYDDDAVVENGPYLDNRKNGMWTQYYITGTKKNEITWNMNRKQGNYVLYYPEGNVEEQGNWGRRRNTGELLRYYKNGQVAQKKEFSESGRSSGKQTFYYENGQVELEYETLEGKENGTMRRYYPNGDLKEERVYNNGAVDSTSIKEFEMTSPEEMIVEENVVVSEGVVNIEPTEKPKGGTWDPNGYNVTYRKDRQIKSKGNFKNNRLWKGEQFIYNDDGILIKIEKVEKGKVVGNRPID